MDFVFLPSLKTLDPQQSGRLQGVVAKRFSMVAWSSILVLLVTGYFKTPDGMLADTSTEMGLILTIKHIIILAVILVGLTIGLYVVPNLKKYSPKAGERPADEFFRFQKLLHKLATTNLVLGICILICASMLW
jgi:uncharacterized membrane protein